MSNCDYEFPLFPADWGKRQRKALIEISESPDKRIHFECFIEENGIKISATAISRSLTADFAPLIGICNKLLESIPNDIIEEAE